MRPLMSRPPAQRCLQRGAEPRSTSSPNSRQKHLPAELCVFVSRDLLCVSMGLLHVCWSLSSLWKGMILLICPYFLAGMATWKIIITSCYFHLRNMRMSRCVLWSVTCSRWPPTPDYITSSTMLANEHSCKVEQETASTFFQNWVHGL